MIITLPMIVVYLVIGFFVMSVGVYFGAIGKYDSPILYVLFWPLMPIIFSVIKGMDLLDNSLKRYTNYVRSLKKAE